MSTVVEGPAQGTILWSELIRDFNAAYDLVFENMGRKAYFDFNRASPPAPGSNFIDGAKKRWKLPFLMDAVSCAFYRIQPSTHRRKARKFNQHEVLAKVLRSLVGRAREHSNGPLTLVVDTPTWTTFAILRREFEFCAPQRSATKYQNIAAMYLFDQGMTDLGLPNVLAAVAEILVNVTSLVVTASANDYTTAADDSINYPSAVPSVRSDSPEVSRENTVHTAGSIDTTDSMFIAISDDSLRKSVLNRRGEASTPSLIGNWTADPSLLVVILAANGTPLQQLYGDGSFISFAARASEAVDLQLASNSDPLQWIFKATDAAGAQTLVDRGGFRVFGNDLLTARYTPFI